MTPVELEELLREIPDFAPSPALEGRIAEAAKRRTPARPWFRGLIPVAAAFLFCVGAVWMALPTPGGKGKPEGPMVVQFFEEGGRWMTSPAEFLTLIPKVKDRGVVLAGPDSTPWGLIQPVRKACAKAGIPSNEWRMADRRLVVPTPRPYIPPRPGAPELVRLEEIVAVLRRDGAGDGLVRRIGTRKPMDSTEEMIQLILRMTSDYRKAGKTEFPVYIDAGKDIPWKEVVFMMDAIRKAGIDLVEPDLPPGPDEPEKFETIPRGPDQKLFPPPEDK
jgi:hypothetical protein